MITVTGTPKVCRIFGKDCEPEIALAFSCIEEMYGNPWAYLQWPEGLPHRHEVKVGAGENRYLKYKAIKKAFFENHPREKAEFDASRDRYYAQLNDQLHILYGVAKKQRIRLIEKGSIGKISVRWVVRKKGNPIGLIAFHQNINNPKNRRYKALKPFIRETPEHRRIG